MASFQVVIPHQLKGRGFRFTRLSLSRMDGKAPIDKDFYDGGALREDDPHLLIHIGAGDGYGMVCNYGDLMAFDADQGEILEKMGIMARLPPTLTDRVPNKPESSHLYYVCHGLPQTFHFYHPSKVVEVGGGEAKELKRLELGQICAGRGHIVGPNSPHHKGGHREIIDDSPLAEITIDDIKNILEDVAFSEDPTKNPTFEEAAGLVDTSAWDELRRREKEARKARRGGDDLTLSEKIGDIRRVLSAYGWSPTTKSGDEWKGDVPDEFSKSKTALSVNVAEGLWYCHHHEGSGGDAAALVALFEGLINCREKDRLRDPILFKDVLKACEEKGLIPFEGDHKTDETEAAELLETLAEKLKADPQKINDVDVKKALLRLREHDRIKYGLLVKDLPVGRRDLDKGLDQLAARLEAEKTDEEVPPDEPDEVINADAARIIAKGQSFEYIYKVWQKRHLGDARAGKVLIISTGAQSSSNTAGIHVILNGPRGCGKSDILQKAAALLPQKHLLFGDMSPQAIYYFAQKMPDGAVVAFDDVTFNDTYAAVQKRCTTRFQEGAEHHVVLERGPWTFRTKPRISFWCTSVDRQFDEQLQDRYFAVNVEDSPEHKAAVIEFMKKRDAGIDREEEERETRICRTIIRDLKDHLFEVKIPFADRITLLTGVGERGYNIISDMVKAFCAFRYAVRETDDRGRLVATERDFNDAKALFDDAEGHSEEKYTEPEKKVLKGLINCAYVATLENLSDATKLSSGRLKDILNGRGRDEQKRYGLLAKCHSLTVERVSETVYYESEPGKPKSKTVTRNEYKLDRNFALSEVYNSLVYLEPVTGDDDVPRRKGDVAVDVKETDVQREVDVDDVLGEREIENTSDTSRGDTPPASGEGTSGEKISNPPKTPDDTSTTLKEVPDNDLWGVNHYVGETLGYVGDVSDTSTSESELSATKKERGEVQHPITEPSDEIKAEALEIVRGLNGKAITFGNVEAYLEARAGGFVPPKAVKRALNVLAAMGGTTDKNGILTMPEGVAL